MHCPRLPLGDHQTGGAGIDFGGVVGGQIGIDFEKLGDFAKSIECSRCAVPGTGGDDTHGTDFSETLVSLIGDVEHATDAHGQASRIGETGGRACGVDEA